MVKEFGWVLGRRCCGPLRLHVSARLLCLEELCLVGAIVTCYVLVGRIVHHHLVLVDSLEWLTYRSCYLMLWVHVCWWVIIVLLSIRWLLWFRVIAAIFWACARVSTIIRFRAIKGLIDIMRITLKWDIFDFDQPLSSHFDIAAHISFKIIVLQTFLLLDFSDFAFFLVLYLLSYLLLYSWSDFL